MIGRRTPSPCVAFLLIVLLIGCGPSAARRADLIAQGDAFMAAKDYVKAAAAYADAKPGKRDGPLLLKLAQANLKAGRVAEAFRAAIPAADLLPDSEEAQVLAARILVRGSRFDNALARLVKVLAKHPDHVEALILQGNAAARLNTTTVALTTLAWNNSADDELSRLKLRTGASKDGDTVAEQALRKAVALQTDPNLVEAQEALINFLWAVGRAEDTESMLQALADRHPDNWVASQALGDFYLLRHREQEAEPHLVRAAADPAGSHARRKLYNLYIDTKRPREARAVLTSMLAKDDADGGVSLRLASLDLQAGQPDEALRRIEPLLARKPPVPGVTVLKARALVAKGAWAEALALANRAAAADSKSSQARTVLGQILTEMGNLEDAYDAHAEAVRIDSEAVASRRELARLAVALGRATPAVANAREAVRLDSGSRESTLSLVKALILAKDFAGAEQTLKPLITREPAAADFLVQQGSLLAARGNDRSARAAFIRALQLAPDSLDAVSGIVTLDLQAGRLEDARQRAEDGVAKHPRDPGYLELEARVYTAARDASRAEAALREVLRLDPANLNAALSLAKALASTRPEEAKQVLEQLLARRPHAAKAHAAMVGLSR